MSSLAARHGTTTEALWQHPRNAALRERRSDPNVLHPGDEIFVPDGGEGRGRVDPGSRKRFTARRERVMLRLALLDETIEGEETVRGARETSGTVTTYRAPASVTTRVASLARTPFRLEVGATATEGTTDAEGVLEVAIDPTATRARLVLEPGTEHERALELRIGHLDPASETSGVAQRLINLGFPCQLDGTDAEPAIAAYQKSRQLGVTGRLDDATRQRLEQEGGS